MKVYVTLIIIFLISFNITAFAQVINSKFSPAQEITLIKEGDLIEATLKFWPIESADLSQFKKLEKAILFNAFYLAQIISLDVSPNNADVVELKAIFIVKSSKPQSLFVFKYNETPIELRIENLKIQELKEKSQDYIILNQPLSKSYLSIVVLVFIVLLVILLFFKRMAIKEFFKKIKKDDVLKSKKRYDELFRTANKREDFELLYKEKEIWLKLLLSTAPAHNEFFKVLNQVQFKKDWSNEDYAEVRSAFDVIRRSFEK